jgi:lysophospholipase L1-like esterase
MVGAVVAQPQPLSENNMTDQCLLRNVFTKCLEQKKLRISVIGNSVTYGAAFDGQKIDSFYVRLAPWFKRHFPDAEIEVRTGIIFAMGPEVQLFRMEEKLLAFNPDLVVAEFSAANAAWGAKGRGVTDPATEGYVRRLRLLRPDTDMLLNLGLFIAEMDDYRAGRRPPTVEYLYAVADRYGCVLTDAGEALARRILAGEKWETFMNDGIHPGPAGYAVHGEVIERELDRQWALYQQLPPAQRVVTARALPSATVTPAPWVWPRLVPAWFAENLRDFTPGEHGRVKYLEGWPGATGSYSAGRGRIVGILHHLGGANPEPRANVEVRFDGAGDWTELNLKHEPGFPEDDDRDNLFKRQFFGGYGLPAAGCHTLEFRVVPNADHAPARLAGFFVIEQDGDLGFQRK